MAFLAFEHPEIDLATPHHIERRFQARACRAMRAEGIDQFLVLDAGAPVAGHVHEVVPDSFVLYTDRDRATAARGRKLVACRPGAGYTTCDPVHLTSLDRGEVARVLGPLDRLGIVFIGLAAFMPDDALGQALAGLYSFAPAGSMLAVDFPDHSAAGTPLYARDVEQMWSLMPPWRVTEDGIVPVGAWRNDDADARHRPAYFRGCLARKSRSLGDRLKV